MYVFRNGSVLSLRASYARQPGTALHSFTTTASQLEEWCFTKLEGKHSITLMGSKVFHQW